MNKVLSKTLLTLATGLLVAPAFSAPILRTEVAVDSAIVTAGDIFADVGVHAERAMFKAPAPGTKGNVSLNAIRVAAKRIGIDEFDTPPIDRIQVARNGVDVDWSVVETAMLGELEDRALLVEGATTRISPDRTFEPVKAATTGAPVHIASLNYARGGSVFSAQIEIAGYTRPINIRGRIETFVEVPHLAASLSMGDIIAPGDIVLKAVPLQYAEQSALATVDQLVGKEMRRPAREGMIIRASDVVVPQIVKRSDYVTLSYVSGPMRLTVKGQALNDAAAGEPVAVLNLNSKKIVHGLARDAGSVELVLPQAETGLKS